jgi:hypothetical protein
MIDVPDREADVLACIEIGCATFSKSSDDIDAGLLFNAVTLCESRRAIVVDGLAEHVDTTA